MPKVLVSLRSPDDVAAMRLGAKIARELGANMAVCQPRDQGDDARSDLVLQRTITSMLRTTLGAFAEEIPVFVLGESVQDDLAAVIATWSADLLVTDGNIEPIT